MLIVKELLWLASMMTNFQQFFFFLIGSSLWFPLFTLGFIISPLLCCLQCFVSWFNSIKSFFSISSLWSISLTFLSCSLGDIKNKSILWVISKNTMKLYPEDEMKTKREMVFFCEFMVLFCDFGNLICNLPFIFKPYRSNARLSCSSFFSDEIRSFTLEWLYLINWKMPIGL